MGDPDDDRNPYDLARAFGIAAVVFVVVGTWVLILWAIVSLF